MTTRLLNPVISARGQIQLILGPMFSGKTTELLRRTRRHTLARQEVLLIKHGMINIRPTDLISTHDL